MCRPFLDHVARAYYEIAYEYRYVKCNGQAFRDFFSEIMEKRHGQDFSLVKPWGPRADRKCDGYLTPSRTIFGVYALNEFEAARIVKKVRRDFEAAIREWTTFVACWTFVHNCRTALRPEVEHVLLMFEIACRKITVRRWGFEELRQQVFELTPADLATLLGPGIWYSDVLDLRNDDLLPLLRRLGEATLQDASDVQAMAPARIQLDTLSTSTVELLTAGTGKTHLVRDVLRNAADPHFGDCVATAFKKRYAELKVQAVDPNMIFYELLSFTAGPMRQLPREEAAALAIVAHLLEACHIV